MIGTTVTGHATGEASPPVDEARVHDALAPLLGERAGAFVAAGIPLVVSTSFTLEIGEASGTINFCIPYATFEPIRNVLYSTMHGASNAPDHRWMNLMTQQIQSAEVELVAELAQAPAINAREVAACPQYHLRYSSSFSAAGSAAAAHALML